MKGDKCKPFGGKVRTDLLPDISDLYTISEPQFRILSSELCKNILLMARHNILDYDYTYFTLFHSTLIV